jgi:hypothetical protein
MTFADWGHDTYHFYPSIYKVGELRGCDFATIDAPPGAQDSSIYCDALQYGGPQSLTYVEWNYGFPYTYASAPIIRWAGGTNQFGVSGSTYAYGAADLTGAYNVINGYATGSPPYSITYSLFSLLDDKPSGGDQIVIEHHATAVTVANTSIKETIHAPQCASCPFTTGGDPTAYKQGSTTVTAASCKLVEQESGNTTGSNPQAKYGMVLEVVSPGTITCTDLGESSGTYSNGFTHNMEVCAGSSGSGGTGGACGTNVSSADLFVVSKIGDQTASGFSTLTSTIINPSGFSAAGYVGVQAVGANSASILIDTVDSSLHGAVPNFTTSGFTTGNYTIAGLQAGIYSVYLGASQVTGSPFTVTGTADSTVHFVAAAGTISFSGAGPSAGGSVVNGQTKSSGNVIIH